MAEKLHDAFISYSRKDRAFATLLEKALEDFSPPKIGTIPQKHLDIFRDEEDITGTDYHKAVSKHLQDSRKLIVICTPAARASQYVNDEIRLFAKTNGSEYIIPILLDGLPNNEATKQQEANQAFPDALVNCVQMPLAIDYRDFRLDSSDKVSKGKFESEWFSLLANLYGVSRSEIEQRERKRQVRIRNLLIALIVILFGLLGLAIFNWFEAEQAKEAEQQATKTAIEQRDKAQHAFAVAGIREAQRLIDNHDSARALMHLAQATRFDPLWIFSRTWLVNLMQQKKWHLPNQILKHGDNFTLAAFSADGTRVVTASLDGTARVWDAQSGKALGESMRLEGNVRSAVFSADGTRVMTASDDNTVRMWDAHSGKALGGPMRHEAGVLSATFSADGTRVVTVSGDGMVRIWNAQSGKALSEPMRHENYVLSAVSSADGTRVVTVSDDNAVRVWDAQSGKVLGEPMRHKYGVLSAAFSTDGTRVVTASDDNTVRMWDAQSGKALGEPMRHKDGVLSAVFSTDGARVVTVSWDETVRVWDAQSGKALGEPMLHVDEVLSAVFSVDGTRVVTVSNDGTARVWDAQSGEALGEPMRHEGKVLSAAFCADGARVVTVSEDGTMRMWDVLSVVSDSDNLLAELAEAVAGLKLGEYDAIDTLQDQIERLNQLRQQTAHAPLGEPTAESFVRWFLSDPWTRTISPLSKKTVPEYIQQEIEAGRREQVAQEFPGHPLLRQEKQVEATVQQIDLQPKPAIPIPAVNRSILVAN